MKSEIINNETFTREYLFSGLPHKLEVEEGMVYRILTRRPIHIQGAYHNFQYVTDLIFECEKSDVLRLTANSVSTIKEYISIWGAPSGKALAQFGGINAGRTNALTWAALATTSNFSASYWPLLFVGSFFRTVKVYEINIARVDTNNFATCVPKSSISSLLLADSSSGAFGGFVNPLMSQGGNGAANSVHGFHWKAPPNKPLLMPVDGGFLLYGLSDAAATYIFGTIYYASL